MRSGKEKSGKEKSGERKKGKRKHKKKRPLFLPQEGTAASFPPQTQRGEAPGRATEKAPWGGLQGCWGGTMKKLVNPSLAVGDIHTRRDTEAADEDIEIRTHFLPPFAGRAKPWNHAPTKAKTPPARNPACQSSRKNAVATSATLSMAKRFDQYCNMMPPKHAFHPLPFLSSAFCCCRQQGGGRGVCLLCAGNRKGPVGGRWVFVASGEGGLVLAAQVEAVEIQASHERPGKKP